MDSYENNAAASAAVPENMIHTIYPFQLHKPATSDSLKIYPPMSPINRDARKAVGFQVPIRGCISSVRFHAARVCKSCHSFQIVAGGFSLMAATAARACPLCASETGRQVRAGIFNEHFGATLLAVLSPFPLLLLVLAALHYGLPRMGKADRQAKAAPPDVLLP